MMVVCTLTGRMQGKHTAMILFFDALAYALQTVLAHVTVTLCVSLVTLLDPSEIIANQVAPLFLGEAYHETSRAIVTVTWQTLWVA